MNNTVDIGPRGIQANISYYKSLIEKKRQELAELERELAAWEAQQ
jgi:hypothetical protein